MPGVGLETHTAAVLWTEIALLLLLARLLGAVAKRLGQPPILGSLCAGLVAGPSVLGHAWPAALRWLRPDAPPQSALLGAIAGFGLLILLISLGEETDLRLIRSLGRPAMSLITASLALPLGVGVAVALVLPRSFAGSGGHRTSFVLLMSAAMAVSSLPVIARIMTEMGMSRRDVGQLSVATAAANDAAGFLLLAFAVALAGSGGSSRLPLAIGGLIGLVVVMPTGGQWAVDRALRMSRRSGPDVAAGTAACVAFTLVVAAVAQALGIEAALGAFLAGIVIGRSRFAPQGVLDLLRWSSDAVFAPLYFATAGLSVDVTLLRNPSTALWAVVVFVAAVVSKFVASYAGGRMARLPAREAAALGFSLNGRGALQVIIGSAGLAAGILAPAAYTVVILVSIVSSMAAPPLLRRMLAGWRGTPQERERLDHEREMSDNVVVRGQRLLLPSRGRLNSVAAATIADLAWPDSSEVTVLRIPGERYDAEGIRAVREILAPRRVREEAADTQQADAVEAILAEANLGHGVIVVGAAEEPSSQHVLPVFFQQLMNRSPIPLLIVRRGRSDAPETRLNLRPRRIVVPVTGDAASRAGREVAQAISHNTGADVEFVHVVTRPPVEAATGRVRSRSHVSAAATVLDDARRSAADRNLDADVVLLEGSSSGAAIAQHARHTDSDLVIIGTTVRRVHERPFLGHTVEHVLEELRAPTIAVVVLPDAQHMAADAHVDRTAG